MVGKTNGAVAFCAQFFPDAPAHARLLQEAALASGWVEATLVVDQTHHTDGHRWYIVCRKEREEDRRHRSLQEQPGPLLCERASEHSRFCRMYSTDGVAVQCALLLDETTAGNTPILTPAFGAHLEWLSNNHIKYARGLIRRLNYTETLPDHATTAADSAEGPRKRRKVKKGATMTPVERELAAVLRGQFGAAVSLVELGARRAEVISALHASTLH